MIKVELVGLETAQARIKKLTPNIRKSLLTAMYRIVEDLRKYVITQKLSGQVLNHISGKLWRSIHTSVNNGTTSVTGRVFATSDCKYAAIHEYGGTIKHPGGTAYLVTDEGSTFISNIRVTEVESKVKRELKRTRPHNINMPARSYLRSSLKDNQQKIRDALSRAVAEGTK